MPLAFAYTLHVGQAGCTPCKNKLQQGRPLMAGERNSCCACGEYGKTCNKSNRSSSARAHGQPSTPMALAAVSALSDCPIARQAYRPAAPAASQSSLTQEQASSKYAGYCYCHCYGFCDRACCPQVCQCCRGSIMVHAHVATAARP
jgi:hypothetical protein